MAATATSEPMNDGKITCQIDQALVHSIQLHLKDHHPDWTIERYREEYPDAPLLSEFAKSHLAKKRAAKAQAEAEGLQANAIGANVVQMQPKAGGVTSKKIAMHDLFGMGAAPAARAANGDPVMLDVYENHDLEAMTYVPAVDDNYIFDIETVKTVIMGQKLNIPTYFWGMHGTGKTTAFEQYHARTRIPFMRVQHTIDTETSHIVGMWTVKDGETVFQLGPLAEAMMRGYTYCADEYDFAMPAVLGVYQPVLEGKPLVIKEAPPEMRVIRPHPNFRFVATGNTNGGGDDTGLYQGTQMQNAANYSRFGIVKEIHYMEPKLETAIVSAQAMVDMKDAGNIVQIAVEIRNAFKAGNLSSTISTRELIGIGKIGLVRRDFNVGFAYGFINRLSRVDQEVVKQYAERVLGK